MSNAAWGYAFYFALALLSFGKIATPAAWSRRLHLLGEIAVAVALLYSGYLVYFQAFVAGKFCTLCLASSGLVLALAVLHAVLRVRGGHQPVDDGARAMELGLAGGALFGAMGILIGVLVFVNRLGTRIPDEGSGAVEMRRIVGRMLPAFIDPKELTRLRACHFDGLRAPLDVTKFIAPTTPFLGKPGGLPVLIFLDPHCAHCRENHATYFALAERFKDRARFYLLPRTLWEFSVPAAAALKLAEGSGKYFELWKLQLAARRRLPVEHLAELYRQLGLDATDLAARIEQARPAVRAERERAAAHGVGSLPAIFINGQEVFWSDYSEECLANLIEDALAASERPAPRSPPK